MRTYTYAFVWVDKDGINQKRYYEAASQVDATKEFEKDTGLDIFKDAVITRRGRV